MRVFLLWADKSAELVHLMKALNSAPHTLVYWLGQTGAEANNQPGVIFHPHTDANAGIPAKGVDTSAFEPPSKELIERLYKVESIVMTMLNRTMDAACVDERKHFYYELLRYWLGVIRAYKPDVLIFPVEPHGAYDYIAYELAKIMGIKTFCFTESRVSDRLLHMTDIREGSPTLLKMLEKNRGKSFTLDDLSADIRAYYLKHSGSGKDSTPQYVSYLKNKYSFFHRFTFGKISRSIRDGTFFSKIYRLLFVEKNFLMLRRFAVELTYTVRPNLKKEYRSLEFQADLSEKFIYAPLQVQPERSTSPMGDMFVDQILMLETISASLPPGWKIYVKEHPIQWVRIGSHFSSSRYPGYYQKISRLKNVTLVPIETSSFELMRASQAVATVTGAPGWEAMVRGKPALVFGYAWYKESPAAFRVRDVASCQDALRAIEKGEVAEKNDIINYLKCLDEASIHGFIAGSNAATATVNRQQNFEGITELILRELKSYEA